MVDALEALMTLRSLRRYTDEPVTDEEIMTCIRAAVQAPNGGNVQPWQFVVVTDRTVKEAVAAVYQRAYNRYERAAIAALPTGRPPEEVAAKARSHRAARYLAEHLADAPALVFVLMNNLPWVRHDEEGPMDIGPLWGSVFPAVQNLMLAARALGIGTALTTVFRIYQNDMRAALAIPAIYEIAAMIPMGRPKGKFGVAPRKPAEQVTHWNGFGNRRE